MHMFSIFICWLPPTLLQTYINTFEFFNIWIFYWFAGIKVGLNAIQYVHFSEACCSIFELSRRNKNVCNSNRSSITPVVLAFVSYLLFSLGCSRISTHLFIGCMIVCFFCQILHNFFYLHRCSSTLSSNTS